MGGKGNFIPEGKFQLHSGLHNTELFIQHKLIKMYLEMSMVSSIKIHEIKDYGIAQFTSWHFCNQIRNFQNKNTVIVATIIIFVCVIVAGNQTEPHTNETYTNERLHWKSGR